ILELTQTARASTSNARLPRVPVPRPRRVIRRNSLRPCRRNSLRPCLMRIDHHLHTSRHSPDSEIDPWELVEHARDIGLDGLVITEHDYQWGSEELSELSAGAAPLRVFSGAEVSAHQGHFLVYGLPSLDEVPPGIELADLLRIIRRHGAAIV